MVSSIGRHTAVIPFNREHVKNYLDKTIRFWRKKKVEKAYPDGYAECYIDAYQSVRESLFGERLEDES